MYGDLTLAIPKGELKRGDTWEMAGSKFSVVSVSLSGEETDYVIAADVDNATEKLNIYFNQRRGIWGMKFGGGEMYRVEGSCGLGCLRNNPRINGPSSE
jgi:hypothetical protein